MTNKQDLEECEHVWVIKRIGARGHEEVHCARCMLCLSFQRALQMLDEARSQRDSALSDIAKLDALHLQELQRMDSALAHARSDGAIVALQAQLDDVAEAIGAERMAAADGYHGTAVRAVVAELARLTKYIAINDEEYRTMKDVLRAEHAEVERMRASDLALDDYEAVNLLWLLRVARMIGLDTGDWLGQLLFKMAARGHGEIREPNSPPRDTDARLDAFARARLLAVSK